MAQARRADAVTDGLNREGFTEPPAIDQGDVAIVRIAAANTIGRLREDLQEARADLDQLRERVAALAEGLEHRAEINHPSKVSEICKGIADSLRSALH